MCRHGENIYKRKDGRYEGRYIVGKTDEGKTRFGYVYGYQYMEVRRKLAEHKTALLTQSLTDAPARCRITLREWMMHWMENEVLGSVKASSYQTYLIQINKHILPALGGLYLTQLTPALAYELTENMRAAGLSVSTVKGIFRLLSAAMQSALDEGVIKKNPCRKIKIRQEEQMEQRVLSRSEQEKVRSAADVHGDLPVLLSLYEKASAKHDKLEAEIARRNNKARQLASFIDHLEKAPASLEEWDSQVWSLLLEKGTVNRDGSVAFEFRNGKEIKVEAK